MSDLPSIPFIKSELHCGREVKQFRAILQNWWRDHPRSHYLKKQIFFRKSYAPQIGATYIVPLRADNMETTLTVIDDIIIWITL